MTTEPDGTEKHEGGIVVSCLSCGRVATLSPSGDAADLPLVHLTRRLRCSECGSGAVKAERSGTPQDVARGLRLRMKGGRS